jgi:CHASE2 domain-containing sensor protein
MSGPPQSGPGIVRRVLPLFLSALFALGSTLALAELVPSYAPGLLRFDHYLGDARSAYLADRQPSQHPRVAIVGITDETLQDLSVRLPIDTELLTRLVQAIDAAGARAIGLDILFTRYTGTPTEQRFVQALRDARAKIVLAAVDARIALSPTQAARHKAFLDAVGRPAGFVNLAVERDWIVRFQAQPLINSAHPKSFARVLAEEGGTSHFSSSPRIAWLGPPADGTDAFLTIPGEVILGSATSPVARASLAGLRDKIVIVGGMFPDIDRHVTPLSVRTNERTPGVLIHANIAAAYVDGRSVGEPDTSLLPIRIILALLAGVGFLAGWRFRHTHKGLLAGSIATSLIIAVDIFVFWQFRIILPLVLALMAWFLGEFSGHYLGTWLGERKARDA